ncbi:YdcF family protein [Furfurilactobacillus entadae]|uniref:YdcF family protein n=1 Tax=Furfurilactobacillus entadae TaxID=2922307 RepID=UPI0035EF6B08
MQLHDSATLLLLGMWLIAIMFAGGFALSWHIEKRRLINGIWFNIAFYTALAALGGSILHLNNHLLIIAFGVPFIIVLLSIMALFLGQSVLLLWNAAVVWRRESHSVGNMLTLILGLGILLIPLIDRLAGHFLSQRWFNFFAMITDLVVFYLLFWFYNYLTVLVLYQFNRPKLNQQYVIVLGSGLINGGDVPPLLAQRIDRGIRFYQRQRAATGVAPILILSGGQGGNETRPEGVAMREYAVAHGIPADHALAEDRSLNTLQNMLFSRKLMHNIGDHQQPNAIFVTSNYHTLRAGLIAKQAGVKADGIGSHTARFFLPNAIIREYIAVFTRHKWVHAILLGSVILVAGLGLLLPAML